MYIVQAVFTATLALIFNISAVLLPLKAVLTAVTAARDLELPIALVQAVLTATSALILNIRAVKLSFESCSDNYKGHVATIDYCTSCLNS